MNNEPQIRLQWPIENSVHHFQTWGEKKRKRRCFPHPGQVINSRVSSQQITSPLCDRPVILSASTDGLAAPWETTAGMWLKCRFWSKHRHSKLDSGVRNTYDEQKVQQNRTCDLFVHLENFCWDFNSVQRMFATEKKRDSKQLTQKLGRCQTTATSFFYAYCKCSCLSVQKETYARPFNVKKKKKLLLFNEKDLWVIWPWGSKSILLTLLLEWVASVVTRLVPLACKPWSSPVGEPCELSPTWHWSICLHFSLG